MEWIASATLAFSAVGACVGVAQGYFALRRHRREATQEMREEMARWSLRAVPMNDYDQVKSAGWRAFEIVRTTDSAPSVRLIEIAARRPRTGRICPWSYPSEQGLQGPHLGRPVVEKAARRIAFNTDFEPGRRPSNRSSMTAAMFSDWVSTGRSVQRLFAELPERSFWRSSIRFEIRVIAEEMSSMRRKIVVVVRSEQIALTADSAATAK